MQSTILFLLLVSSWAPLTPAPDQSIEGTLVFPQGVPQCDFCRVSLVSNRGHLVDTVYVRTDGRFTFHNVVEGVYTVHAEIAGYEEVRESVEMGPEGWSKTDVTLIMNRKVEARSSPAPISPVVSLRQLQEKYPPKAVAGFKKGMEKNRKGRGDEAMKFFEEAVLLAPEFYDAHAELGLAYKKAGRTDDAERELLKAHELNPSSVNPLVFLCSLYIDENKLDRAVAAGAKAVKLDSHSAPALLSLGVALHRAAEFDLAEIALTRALDLSSQKPQIRLMLVDINVKLRRYDRALIQLDTYISENPKHGQRQAIEEMRDALTRVKDGAITVLQ